MKRDSEAEDLVRRFLVSELVAEGHVVKRDGKVVWEGRFQDYEVEILVHPTGTVRLSEN